MQPDRIERLAVTEEKPVPPAAGATSGGRGDYTTKVLGRGGEQLEKEAREAEELFTVNFFLV